MYAFNSSSEIQVLIAYSSPNSSGWALLKFSIFSFASEIAIRFSGAASVAGFTKGSLLTSSFSTDFEQLTIEIKMRNKVNFIEVFIILISFIVPKYKYFKHDTTPDLKKQEFYCMAQGNLPVKKQGFSHKMVFFYY